MNRIARSFGTLAAACLLLSASGCKSYWIDAQIQNQSGKTLRELEVDYPTASFGADTIAPGGSMHYRLQIRGSGPLKVEYTFEDGKTVHASGLHLQERQAGRLTILILPGGKVDFLPELKAAS